MKKKHWILTAIAAFIAVGAGFLRGDAEAASDDKAQKVGFVDLITVQNQARSVSLAIEGARDRVVESTEKMRQEAEEKTEQQKKLAEEYKAAAVLSKESRDELETQLEKLAVDIEFLTRKINREFEKSVDESASDTMEMILNAIKIVSREQGFSLVVTKSAVLYADSSSDLTPAVIERLNDETPSKPKK